MAFVVGAVLARIDIRITRWLLRLKGYLKEKGKAQQQGSTDTWLSMMLEAMKWVSISFGEEGVRVGTIALLWSFFPTGLSFIQSAILVGLLIGLMHVLYFNFLLVPTKTLFHVLLSLIFVQWGVIASFIIHAAFNLSMLFDIELSNN